MRITVKKIRKSRGEYFIRFRQGNQEFELAFQGTKAHCDWMKDMLKKAFENYKKEIIKKFCQKKSRK